MKPRNDSDITYTNEKQEFVPGFLQRSSLENLIHPATHSVNKTHTMQQRECDPLCAASHQNRLCILQHSDGTGSQYTTLTAQHNRSTVQGMTCKDCTTMQNKDLHLLFGGLIKSKAYSCANLSLWKCPFHTKCIPTEVKWLYILYNTPGFPSITRIFNRLWCVKQGFHKHLGLVMATTKK